MAFSGGTLVGRQVLTATSGTYTPSVGTTAVIVYLQAGGGGGGGAAGGADVAAGAGGASGNCLQFAISTGSIAGGAFTCGAAGTAGGTSGTGGGGGGNSTIVINGTTYTATGGGGGSGMTTTALDNVVLAGAPTTGSTSSGIDTTTGACGTHGFVNVTNIASNFSMFGGSGGSSTMGIGGLGSVQGGGAGGEAGSPGGIGAGGGGASASTTGSAGGAGGVGQIIIEEYSMAATFGGTAQAGGAQTITLAASGSPATDDLIQGQYVVITAGTGAGQSRQVYLYRTSTKIATVWPAWQTNPDSTSVYQLQAGVFSPEIMLVGLAQGGSSNTIILATTASATTAWYGAGGGGVVFIVAGTGAGQSPFTIDNYVGSTRTLELAAGSSWTTNPDATSVYVLMISNGWLQTATLQSTAFASQAISSTTLANNTITAASIAAAALTSAKFDKSTTVIATVNGTASAGGATTMTSNAITSVSANQYAGQILNITAGTGIGQSRTIISHTSGTTPIFTVNRAWVTNPASASSYNIETSDEFQLASDQLATAADVFSQAVPAIVAGSIGEQMIAPAGTVGSGSNTATTFSSNVVTTEGSTQLENQWLCFLTGALIGQSQQIKSNDASGNITMLTAYTGAPSNGDRFILIGK
jgi:hypothetical protein